MSGVSTSSKVQRLLAIVPWVVERDGATVADIAAQFHMSTSAVYDLLLAAMCYEVVGTGTHDNLGIVVFGGDDDEIAGQASGETSGRVPGGAPGNDRGRRGGRRRRTVDRGGARVFVEPGAMLDRQLNLSVPQAFGILVAGQSALSLRGADSGGALATALSKLGDAYRERVRVSVDLATPSCLGALEAALTAGTTVRIHYYTPVTDEVSDRRVDPLALALHDGHWYLRGWCHLRCDARSFRVDRIEECHDTGEQHGRERTPGEAVPSPPVEADGAVEVVLSIPQRDLWRVENYPSLEIRVDGERRLITYAVRSPRVLQQMLLRLGADSCIANAAELPAELADAGRSGAAALLELYDAERSGSVDEIDR